MSWKPVEKFSELRELEGAPIRVPASQFTAVAADGLPDVLLQEGQTIRFSTRNIDARGKVLGLEHSAVYPVKIQWAAPNGDTRTTNFSPDEFLYLKVLS